MSRPGDWYCKYCQNLNFQRRDACHRCGEPRQGGGDYTMMMMSSFGGRGSILNGSSSFGFSTGPDVRPGDWYCNISNCGAHNFASRSSCFKCGASKDDLSSLGGGGGGTTSSSGSGGGFDFHDHLPRMRGFNFGSGVAGSSRSAWKSGDWICSRLDCNEHNFASRMECFRCNAPKDSSY